MSRRRRRGVTPASTAVLHCRRSHEHCRGDEAWHWLCTPGAPMDIERNARRMAMTLRRGLAAVALATLALTAPPAALAAPSDESVLPAEMHTSEKGKRLAARYTPALREMSAKTQFVIITHNRKTMNMAPVLYGVTMQEPGVSRLVSVRFHEAMPQAAGFRREKVSHSFSTSVRPQLCVRAGVPLSLPSVKFFQEKSFVAELPCVIDKSSCVARIRLCFHCKDPNRS